MSDLVAFLNARLDEDAAEYGADDTGRESRTVAAHKAILADYQKADTDYGEFDVIRVNHLRRVVKLLAAIYGDHPDYNEGWRPS